MKQTTVLVDVRDDIRRGREPFSKIMNAAGALREGQSLMLLAPFEPVPLVSILGKQGFRHTARPNENGDWEVLFVRENTPKPARDEIKREASLPAARPAQVIDVDARGLEPPLPMVKILEALGALPEGAELRGRTDRRPLHLYAQLEERGFNSNTVEQPDGSYLTIIRRG